MQPASGSISEGIFAAADMREILRRCKKWRVDVLWLQRDDPIRSRQRFREASNILSPFEIIEEWESQGLRNRLKVALSVPDHVLQLFKQEPSTDAQR